MTWFNQILSKCLSSSNVWYQASVSNSRGKGKVASVFTKVKPSWWWENAVSSIWVTIWRPVNWEHQHVSSLKLRLKTAIANNILEFDRSSSLPFLLCCYVIPISFTQSLYFQSTKFFRKEASCCKIKAQKTAQSWQTTPPAQHPPAVSELKQLIQLSCFIYSYSFSSPGWTKGFW